MKCSKWPNSREGLKYENSPRPGPDQSRLIMGVMVGSFLTAAGLYIDLKQYEQKQIGEELFYYFMHTG